VDLLTTFINYQYTYNHKTSHTSKSSSKFDKITIKLRQQLPTLGTDAFETGQGVTEELLKLKQLVDSIAKRNPNRKKTKKD
jgi:hypothetical protein